MIYLQKKNYFNNILLYFFDKELFYILFFFSNLFERVLQTWEILFEIFWKIVLLILTKYLL